MNPAVPAQLRLSANSKLRNGVLNYIQRRQYAASIDQLNKRHGESLKVGRLSQNAVM
jgi:hypothetical protein